MMRIDGEVEEMKNEINSVEIPIDDLKGYLMRFLKFLVFTALLILASLPFIR